MPAKHIPLGQPAHEAERQGIRFLVEKLPETWTVYSNAFLVERTGVAHELDAVIVAPHGIYVVELKAWRGRIHGNDYDWFIPEAVRSPLGQNRKTAQALRQALRQRDAAAGACWVDHFVFLTHTDALHLTGALSRNHVHSSRTILSALQDAKAYAMRAVGGAPKPDENTKRRLYELLTGMDERQRPARKIHQWLITDVLDSTDRYVEYRARSELLQDQWRILRVYPITGPNPERARERCIWEAQVLARVGRHESILEADPLIQTEEGFCLPFEDFRGITLLTWLEKWGPKVTGQEGIEFRLDLWKKIADAIAFAHSQGVVHRLLRDDAILVPDVARPTEVRITGFDLAKQVHAPGTIAYSTISDPRLAMAAPELQRNGFSSATEATDQWALGVLLGELFKNGRFFRSTDELIRKGRPSLRALRSSAKASLDEVFQRMTHETPAERFPSVREAIAAVEATRTPRTPRADSSPPEPENLPPHTKLNADYEIVRKLGSGGFSTVYEAHHLVTGSKRALKIARDDPNAADILRDEHAALRKLNHPHIVQATDLSGSIVPGRLTLVMERVKGVTLTQWLKEARPHSPQLLRHLGDTLLSALEHLEERGVVHKDIKPDNLLVSEEGITLIDFSLAEKAPDELAIGTAAWRDPKMERWDHETDRYAAALCLFELFTGRHPFDGRPPAPGEALALRPDDLDSPGLRRFFTQALSPSREHRFPSARAMRAYFFGADIGVSSDVAPASRRAAPSDSPDHPLAATNLSGVAEACLRRAGITTQGELLRLTDAQIRSISGLGKKKVEEVIAFRDALRTRGVAAAPSVHDNARPLCERLNGDTTPIQTLSLKPRLQQALLGAGLVQVGQVAMATRSDLLGLEGFGHASIQQVTDALEAFAERGLSDEGIETLEQLMELVLAPLDPFQSEVLELRYGLRGEPLDQGDVAQRLGKGQPEVSRAELTALEKVERRFLQELLECVEGAISQAGGVETVAAVVEVVTTRWRVDRDIRCEGVLTLLQRLNETRLQYHRGKTDSSGQFLLLPSIPPEALDRFLVQAREWARKFPNADAEATRRALRTALPEYELDPIALATRLETDLRCTDTEQLYEAPLIDSAEAVKFALGRVRLPVSVRELVEQTQQAFGEGLLGVTEQTVTEALSQPGSIWRITNGLVDFAMAAASMEPREKSVLPEELRVADRRPEEVALDQLRLTTRGYRLVVTPPERHRQIGRSIARALGVPFFSFEELFLERIEPKFEWYEQGERFSASRLRLEKAAKELFDELVEANCRPGGRFVLGDTGIWQVCRTLDLARRLYDFTTDRDRGLCVLVVPGVYRDNRQTHFNETGGPIFGLPGMVLPMERESTFG